MGPFDPPTPWFEWFEAGEELVSSHNACPSFMARETPAWHSPPREKGYPHLARACGNGFFQAWLRLSCVNSCAQYCDRCSRTDESAPLEHWAQVRRLRHHRLDTVCCSLLSERLEIRFVRWRLQLDAEQYSTA
jgi:hypothetical protein